MPKQYPNKSKTKRETDVIHGALGGWITTRSNIYNIK